MSLRADALVLERADGVHLLGPVTLGLARGERLGLVGESGSGKSLLIQALFGHLPRGVRRTGGGVTAFGIPMERGAPDRDGLRGGRLAWVPQDPARALSPLLTLAEHLALLPGIHRKESRTAALARLAPLLATLGLPAERSFLGRFPHQVSGGQRQRILLAMALSCDPELLVLDEPTSALDPLAQRAFLELIRSLQGQRGLGFLWVTHDLAVAAEACDRLLVLYGGHPVEAGPAGQLLARPRHPYTDRLLRAARREPSGEPGFLGAPDERPAGCPFQPRCPRRQTTCARWGPWRGSPENGLRCVRPAGLPD